MVINLNLLFLEISHLNRKLITEAGSFPSSDFCVAIVIFLSNANPTNWGRSNVEVRSHTDLDADCCMIRSKSRSQALPSVSGKALIIRGK